CCISSIDEAKLAIKYGASALGLVSQMPSGPGVISDEKIIEIMKVIPDNTDSFLLTSETSSEEIIKQHNKFKTKTLQLVDKVDTVVYQELSRQLPGTVLVQVVHVTNDLSVEYATEVSQYVDAILLDSGNPDLKVKELGGTGRVHNWQLSKKIRETVNIPVILAGGLNSENVREAIKTVEPYAVDLCSGVRTNGQLDEVKLKQFFNSVRNFC
ncbi:MAG: phosphoribosylanthranilate isomerase, partial [bacterium]